MKIKTTAEGICPFCGSFNLQYEPVEFVDDTTMYQDVQCDDCKRLFRSWSVIKYDGLTAKVNGEQLDLAVGMEIPDV